MYVWPTKNFYSPVKQYSVYSESTPKTVLEFFMESPLASSVTLKSSPRSERCACLVYGAGTDYEIREVFHSMQQTDNLISGQRSVVPFSKPECDDLGKVLKELAGN